MESFEIRVREEYKNLTKILIDRGLSITTMESITAGQIASLITDTEGASVIFKGAYITYANETKIARGVPTEVIAQYGVYSNETSAAMAAVCKEDFRSDIAIGVTGTAGNVDLDNADSVPGELYFSINFKGEVHNFFRPLGLRASRLEYKLEVAHEVYSELYKLIN